MADKDPLAAIGELVVAQMKQAHESDSARRFEKFDDALGDITTSLGEIVQMLEEGQAKNAEAMAKALTTALKDAMKSLPAPQITVTAPEQTIQVSAPKPEIVVNGPKDWKTMKADVEYHVNGAVKSFTFTKT